MQTGTDDTTYTDQADDGYGDRGDQVGAGADVGEPGTEPATVPERIDVRRNVPLATVLGLGAATLAIAFGLRVVDGGVLLDWVLFGTMVVVAIVHLASLLDSRAPLLVADSQGVRLREGSAWHGIGWREVECLEHLPRRGVRDGHLLLVAPGEDQLVVPLTLATRVRGTRRADLSDDLAGMAGSDADVVEVVPGLDHYPDGPEDREESENDSGGFGGEAGEDHGETVPPVEADGTRDTPHPGQVQHIEHVEPWGAPAESDVPAGEPGDDPYAPTGLDGRGGWGGTTTDLPRVHGDSEEAVVGAETSATGHVAPLADRGRRAVGAVSSLLHRAMPQPNDADSGTTHLATDGATALDATALPTLREVAPTAPPDADDLDTDVHGVRVVNAPGPLEVTSTTQVLGDLQVEPATEPVIGRELRTARERIRLTIDQLAERTRIRPHVLEAMEVDDFAACGGDFYARGHLRTISRVLGLQSGPLVAAYDEKYADAPVDPKRVFESELATGAGGAIRGTRGGRNWSVLVAAVMAAVLVWSLARLVMDSPAPVADAPVLNQSGGITNQAPQPEAVPVKLTAVGGGAKLIVRDGGGDIVFDGRLAFGQSTRLDVAPPVRISSSDGSVTASLDGEEPAALGETGEDVTKTLVP